MTLMDRPRAVLRHLFRNLLRRERVERELNQELDDYLAMLVEEKVAAGMSHDAARRAARLEFGGRDQVSERVRDVRIGTWLVNLIQDVRYGIRMSRRRPGFTTAAVLTLTLGIGATVTIFSLLDTVLLRPLPVENPDELANIYTSCRRGNPYCATSFLEFKDYQSQTRTFTDLASFQPMTVSARAESGSWVSDAMLVTDNYFTLLGLPPFAGQLLTPDMRADADPVVILSHDLWTSRFNGSPEIIGDSLQINAVAFRVIGVTSPGFHGTRAGSRPELWLPIESRSVWARARADTDPLASRGMRWISGTIGRRRPGVTVEQAQSEMRVISDGLEASDPGRQGRFITVEPAGTMTLGAGSAQDVVRFINLLMAGAAATLFIACTNVAGLLLARGAARRREFELRRALGAGRARLVRQLLAEYLVLVIPGTLAGLVVAQGAMTVLGAYDLPGAVSIASLDLGLDARVMTFALVLMVMTGLFGLLPALGTTGVNAAHTVAERSTGQGTGTSIRGQGLLLAVQVAVTIVLLIGAGLFIRSLRNGLGLDIGMSSRHVVIASISPTLGRYSAAQTRALIEAAVTRLTSFPGIESAAVSSMAPLAQGAMGLFAEVDGYARAPDEEVRIEASWVGSEYFQTLGIDVSRGRSFTTSDRETAPLVAVINETMARRYWSDRDPVGGRLKIRSLGGLEVEVVGVSRDVTYGLVGAPGPFVYLPIDQNWVLMDRGPFTLALLAKADTADVPLVTTTRTVLREIDPAAPLLQVTTLDTRMSDLLMPQRLGSLLMTALASVTVVLVAVGIGGAVGYGVSRRRAEIGIRLALGARRRQVTAVMTRAAVVPVAFGLFGGILCSLAVGRLVSTFLYDVTPTDATTMVVASCLLAGVAALAAYVPAHRATAVSPMDVLRAE